MNEVVPQIAPKSLDSIASLLRAGTNRYAWIGLGISVVSLILAMLLSALLQSGEITLASLSEAQSSNPALWLLDGMPFLFLLWGQYVGTLLAYQASAMVLDETRDLRERAHALEFQLTRQQVAGPQLGLPNRDSLLSALRESASGNTAAALLVFDCPQYLDVRYTGGDAPAEELLRQIVARVQSVLRERDFLAHYDINDFAVLVRSIADPDEPARLAARIQLALDTPVSLSNGAVSVRTHLGIAQIPEHGSEATALLRRAETAKFAAATLGRDILLYATRLETEHAETPRLTAELHGALVHDGLLDEYRPQEPLVDGLARRLRLVPVWPHPRRQRLEESQFLDLPDRLSLIYGLSLWQLSQSLSRAIAWARPEGRPQVVVRLAERALALNDLAPSVLRLLAAHDSPPQALALELCERSLVLNEQSARRQLASLRNEGVDVCLAGIGEAGTSASTALRFPISQIALAPRLMQEADSSERAEAVLAGYARLGRALGLQIIVGGVDHEQHRKRAIDLAGHWAEGRLIGGAMSAGEVTRLGTLAPPRTQPGSPPLR